MNILVVSDIHGNFDAFEAVLADSRGVDAVVCLGDLVGYGPQPNEVVRRMMELDPIACLVGNHDLAVLGEVPLDQFNTDAARAAPWTAARLGQEETDWLSHLQPRGTCPGASLAHASPRDPVWEYMDIPDQGPPNFEAFEGPLCFVGHTHVPRVFEQRPGKRFTPVHPLDNGSSLALDDDSRLIINPGSVGQPRDGEWRASYGLWDTDARTFTLCRIEYPVERVQQRILDAGLPPLSAQRLSLGR